ncbi:Uncharacterised protein [Neisseria gonorrhoeae]|uniref:Uncharacterized protein n=1 Tax=Neisseria gonorrhoeae TaxID=485 RepID=A0A378VW15_NEIGO|nr:Uncharacterised protein [Neisseria gonorrhoeae]
MAAGFAADEPAALVQLFQHIAVADFGAAEIDTLLFQGDFHRHIGHDRSDHAADVDTFSGAGFGDDVNQAVAVVNLPVLSTIIRRSPSPSKAIP